MGLTRQQSFSICLKGSQSVELNGGVRDVVMKPRFHEKKKAAVPHLKLGGSLQSDVDQLVA